MNPIVVGIIIAAVGWLVAGLFLFFRIGRFEASAATKAELQNAVTLSGKESKDAIEKVEVRLREEIKDMRSDLRSQMDGLFRELVRK